MGLQEILQAETSADIKSLIGIETDEQDGKKVLAKAVYTQDFIDIKDIFNGMIVTKSGRYLTMLSIHPDNILGKPDRERKIALDNFHSFLRQAPTKMQLKVINRKYSPDKIVKEIEGKIEDTSPSFYRLGKAYESNILDIVSSATIDRKFLLLFEYEPKSTLQKITKPAEIALELARIRYQMANALKRSVGHIEELTDKEIGRYYYEFFNPRTSQIVDYSERVKRVYDDTVKLKGAKSYDEVYVPMDNLLAPKDLDFFVHNDYYIMDGLYRSHIVIPSAGWINGEVHPGFLTSLLVLPEGYDVDIYFKRTPIKMLRESVKFTKKIVKGATQMTKSDDKYKTAERSFRAKEYFLDGLDEGQIPYSISLMFSISALTYEELVLKRKEFEDGLVGVGYRTKRLTFTQDVGFMFSSFTMNTSKTILNLTKKDILSGDLSAFYPFNSYSLDDPDGVVLGINTADYSIVRPNILNTKKYGNSNIIILGQAGSGKSFTMQTLAARYRLMGTQIYAIVPEKAHEWRQACTELGGEFIQLSEGSKDHVNIMDLRPSVSPTQELLDGISIDEVSFLSDKISELLVFVRLLMPQMEAEEEKMLNIALIKVYEKYGITMDNNTVYKEYGKKESGLKEMPIIGDLYEICEEVNELHRVKINLQPFIDGNAQSFNARTNVDLDNKYVVASVEKLKGDMLVLGMFILTSIFTGRIKEDRTERQLLFLDEGAMLIAEGVPDQVAKMVRDLFKLLRGYGGGVCLGTQDMRDLYSKAGGYGAAILAASAIKIIHYLESSELLSMQKEMGLDPQITNIISSFKSQGEALLMYNTTSIPIRVVASEYEKELINSDPRLAKEYLKQRQNAETNTQGDSPERGI